MYTGLDCDAPSDRITKCQFLLALTAVFVVYFFVLPDKERPLYDDLVRAAQPVRSLGCCHPLTLYGGCSLQLVREVGEPNTMRYRVYMWYEGRKISPWHDLPLTMPEIKPYYTFINEVPKGYAPRSPGASAPGAWLTAMCSGLQRDCQVRGEQGGCPEPHHSRHEEGKAAVRALWPALWCPWRGCDAGVARTDFTTRQAW